MLHVLMNGRPIGDLDGAGQRVRLRYAAAVATAPDFVPLSAGMPATRARWRGARLDAWLTGLLPDREGTLRRWRAQFWIRSLDVVELLAHVGEDVAGAAQFIREDRLDTVLARRGSLRLLTDDDLAALAREAQRDRLPYDADAEVGYFSLAGAQAKFAVQRTATGWALPSGAEPSTHILKPAIPGLDHQDAMEVVTMRLARALGLPAARTWLTTFADERVIVVERYDRIFAGGRWQRVHQEDLCQALGVPPLHKYESQGGPGVVACADTIRRHCGEDDVRTFVRALVFNYALRGCDAHARNYSLLLTPGDIRLAPLYDLNTTLTFGDRWATRLAMRIGGEDRLDLITRRHWEQCAGDVAVDSGWLCDELVAMVAQIPDAVATICRSDDLTDATCPVLNTLIDCAASWCAVIARAMRR